jgi:hypothetical protein
MKFEPMKPAPPVTKIMCWFRMAETRDYPAVREDGR